MELRKFKELDSNEILNWIENEREFRLWSADRYDSYPIKAENINLNYKKCSECGNFYPMTLIDEENNVIGHLILRNPNNNLSQIRLGFIIVNNKIRGKGYGKILIKKAIKFAKEELNASEINLGVFSKNESAYKCYKSCGFEEVKTIKNAYKFNDEYWDCIEMILK